MNNKIVKLLHEGFSMKTLENLNNNQIDVLYKRITEQSTGTLNIPKTDTEAITKAKSEKKPFVTYESEIGEEEVTEKAKSKKQQEFFGIVRGMQKGDIPKKGKAGKAAKEMSVKDVKDFASTKHKGLPDEVGEDKKPKKSKEVVKNLEESIMRIIENHLHPTTTKGELLKTIKSYKK
jgi:hypothetical protein